MLAAQTFFCHHRISWAGRWCVDGAAVVRGHLMRQTAAQSPSRNLLSFCSLAALDRTGPREQGSSGPENADVGGRGRGEGPFSVFRNARQLQPLVEVLALREVHRVVTHRFGTELGDGEIGREAPG